MCTPLGSYAQIPSSFDPLPLRDMDNTQMLVRCSQTTELDHLLGREKVAGGPTAGVAWESKEKQLARHYQLYPAGWHRRWVGTRTAGS